MWFACADVAQLHVLVVFLQHFGKYCLEVGESRPFVGYFLPALEHDVITAANDHTMNIVSDNHNYFHILGVYKGAPKDSHP